MNGGIQNIRSAQELLAAFYGSAVITEPIESDFTIGTTATKLPRSTVGERLGVLLSNTGATNFAIAFTSGVTITTGVLLLPGGTYFSDWYYDGDLVSRGLWAISSAAGGTIHMLERVLTGA